MEDTQLSYLSRFDTAVCAETVSAEMVLKVTTAQTGVDVLVPTTSVFSSSERTVAQSSARSCKKPV